MLRRLWILVLVGCALFLGVRLARGGALETDLLAMLPATERNPVAERAITVLAKAQGDRAVFLVGGGADPKASARAFGAALRASGAFQGVLDEVPATDPGELPRLYAAHRFRLPFEGDLAKRVAARLVNPFAGLPGLGAGEDPAGHVQAFLERLPLATSRLTLEDGLLCVRSGEAVDVLVGAALKGSAFDPRVQGEVLAAVARAEAGLPAGTRLLRTGAVFYAAEARTSAEREAGVIGWASVAATVLLFLGVFRSLRHLALGLLCVAAGMGVAAAVALACFGRLHLLTLACGASLLGVAVDYPFLYFAGHLGAGPAWEPRARLARIRPALLVGAGTTVLGFATLALAPFPGLRQLAVFAMAGVAGALATLLLVVPPLLPAPLPERPRLLAAMAGLPRRWRRSAWALAGLAVLAALAVAVRLRADDDVHGLIQPPGILRAQEQAIRDRVGLDNGGRFFLIEGADEAEVLAREEALRARLAGQDGLSGLHALSCFVPSPAVQAEALAGWRARRPALAQALREAGYRPEGYLGLAQEMDQAGDRPLSLRAFLATRASVPFRTLWLGPTGRGVASLALPMGPVASAQLRQATAGLPGVALVDKADSVSTLLGRFRRLVNLALGLAGVLVGLALVRRYGPARGLRVLLPSALGMLLGLAGLALLHLPLTLFASIALALVLGFGVDYTVFLAEAGDDLGPAVLGVLLAGFATLLSFGLLAFSRTPVLQGFGLVVGLGVLGALLAAPWAVEEA